MKIIEDGKRDISRYAKRWEVVDYDFRGSAGVKLVANRIGIFEQDRGQFVRGRFLGGFIFYGLTRSLTNGIDLHHHRPLAGLPLFKLLKHTASELPSANVELVPRLCVHRIFAHRLVSILS